MTVEEEQNLEPKPIKPCFKDVSSHKRQFTVQKSFGPLGGYQVSTSDDELSITDSDEEMDDAAVGTVVPGGASLLPINIASLVCEPILHPEVSRNFPYFVN